jgi:seryl-tRNA synthetase
MLDQTYVRENLEAVREGLRRRGMNPDQALESIAQLLADRRRVIPEFEELKRQQNASGEEIGRAKRQGLDTTAIQEAGRDRAQQINTHQTQDD